MMNATTTGTLHNFTRKSESVAAKLWRKRRFGMLMKYGLMRLSDLGREGIEHSGSYRFADHIYRNEASGRGILGKLIDRKLLNMPATQAFRLRYLRAQDLIRERLEESAERRLRVLAVPCGIPRDVGELETRLRKRIDYTGIDLDLNVLDAAGKFLDERPLGSVELRQGDALDPNTFPAESFDVIVCTGLGEFLDDTQLAQLYANAFDALAPGGVFYTSATDIEPKSEALMRAMELETNYRDRAALSEVFKGSGRDWSGIDSDMDSSGLQTFVCAKR